MMENSIRDLRTHARLTQSEVAKMSNVSLRTYQSYESGAVKQDSPAYLHVRKVLEDYLLVDEEHGILTIDDIKQACQEVFKNYDVSYAYLYGSYAKGYATEKSDVDLFVNTSVVGLDYYGMVDELYEKLHKNIELVNQRQFRENQDFLLNEIIKDGVRVYG